MNTHVEMDGQVPRVDPAAAQRLAALVGDNVERVVVGKRREVELVLVALLCRGHVLIEDVPGVGKTVLAKAIARSIGATFKRIQFTPDLLPSDVTGVNVFNPRTAGFEFRPGPIFGHLILADEINRATPKTQSALLEAMEEAQVTVDGVTHRLPEPFVVLATENPIDYEGTFPLPEAQLDRFLIRLALGYPGRAGELEMLERQHLTHPLDSLQPVATVEQLLAAQAAVKAVHVGENAKAYIVSLVEGTRRHEEAQLGASPRGSLALYNAARAYRALRGPDPGDDFLFVKPDDIKELALPTLAHRVIVSTAARMKNIDSRAVVADVLHRVPVPDWRPTPTGGRERGPVPWSR